MASPEQHFDSGTEIPLFDTEEYTVIDPSAISHAELLKIIASTREGAVASDSLPHAQEGTQLHLDDAIAAAEAHEAPLSKPQNFNDLSDEAYDALVKENAAERAREWGR